MPRALTLGLVPCLLAAVLTVAGPAPAPAAVPLPPPPPGTTSAPAPTTRAASRTTPRSDLLLARVRALPAVASAREVYSPVPGYRSLHLQVRQPVDHARPRAETFLQRVFVLHRDESRPTVLVTEGYGLRSPSDLDEVSRLLGANQVRVEHRFFTPSRPADPRWSRQLTIRQAAADLHRVVRSLHHLYDRRWISTGVSKSGMTATYFRRFYPADVVGTVAYSAPDDVVDDEDDAYADFLAQVGPQDCHDAILAVQRRTLGPDRAWFEERTRQAALAQGWTWHVVGSPEKAMEGGVIDVLFAFWQYQDVYSCDQVPGPGATRQAVWRWYEAVGSLTASADQPLRPYIPYYFQAAAQLGAPAAYEAPVADLLRFPGTDVAATFVPAALRPIPRDDAAMPDVDRWVRQDANRIIFLYGGNDPWSAEPFTCGGATSARRRGCHQYVAAGANHGVRITDLPRAERSTVTRTLRRWGGVS